jgi:hypothetical protein
MTLAALPKRSQSLHDTLLHAQSDGLTSASRISVHEKMALTIALEAEKSQSSEIRGRELAFAVYTALLSTSL